MLRPMRTSLVLLALVGSLACRPEGGARSEPPTGGSEDAGERPEREATEASPATTVAGSSEAKPAGHEPSAAWRGAKASIYEGGHRVPFVARWPGVIQPGRSAETVCLTDLMATFAHIYRIPLPKDAAPDSFDLMPLLKGDKLTAPIREATVHQSSQGQLAIRQGKWKLILAPGKQAPAKSSEPNAAELYDLGEDEPVGIELPVTVDLKVTDTAHGIKGATASAQVKPATLETGLVVQVPPFVNTGDSIRVSTETGEYLSRA